jgi:hypothetical protein
MHSIAELTQSDRHFQNDFSPFMRRAGKHLMSSAHILQRQYGADLRD